MLSEGFLAPDLALHNLNNPAKTRVAVIGLPTRSSVGRRFDTRPVRVRLLGRSHGRWKHIYPFTMTNRLVLEVLAELAKCCDSILR
jgi:hypothetical protein